MADEVSSRVVRAALDTAALAGIACDRLTENLAFDAASLKRRRTVAWDDYCTVLERLEAEAGGPTGIERVGESYYHLVLPEVRTIAGALIEPRHLYHIVYRVFDPMLFPSLDFTAEDLADGRLELRIALRSRARPCETFFRATAGATRGLACHLNLPPALVEATIGPRDGSYVVTLPASRTILAKLRRRAWRTPAERTREVPASADRGARARRLAEDLSMHADLDAIGELIVRRLRVDLAYAAIVLSVDASDRLPARVFRAPSRPSADRSVSVHFDIVRAGRRVGRLTVGPPRGDEYEVLRSLLPVIALALDGARASPAAPRAVGPLAEPLPDAPKDMSVRLHAARDLFRLTDRQTDALQGLVQGLTNKEIATTLGCAESTVEEHVTQLFRKIGVENRAQLVARFWTTPRHDSHLE